MKRLIKNHVGALVAWILIVLIAIFTLPDVNTLTRQHSEIRLPADVESSLADNIQNQWGHHQKNTYQIAAVFNQKDGKMTAEDRENVKSTIKYLKDNKKKLGIKTMLAPYDNIATKKKLIAKDKTTVVAQFYVSKSHGSVSQINQQLTKAIKTKGLRTYITGADILTDDFSAAVQEGIKKTEVISIIFIFIVLVLVFKSPIVPLISLLTVGVSFITAFSIVTNLVDKVDFPFSNFTQVFMVIVLFGIGTDYNILLYDKFKENLGKGMEKWEATKDAQHKAGKTILYSGSSILIGFFALGLAHFSVYQSAVGVAVGVAVLLIVLLTLNPFFMAILGKKMFWPVKKFEGETTSKLWHNISAGTLKRPVTYLLIVAVVTIPFIMMYSNHLNYDDTQEISDSTPSKAGLLIVQKHFSKGLAEPTYLYIKADHSLDNEKDLKAIDSLTRKLQASKDVDFATSVTQPYGEKVKKLYVNQQMKTVTSGVATAQNGLTKLSDGSSKMTNGLGQLQSGSQQLVNGLNQLSTQLSGQLGGSNATQLAQLESGIPQINSGIQRLNGALQQSNAGVDTSALKQNLTNVGVQAQVIGGNLTAAGQTLQALQNSGSTNIDVAQLMQAYQQAEAKAQLTPAQKQVMEATMSQIMSGVKNQADQKTASTAAQLKKVAGNLQAAGSADQSLGRSMTQVSGSAQNLNQLMSQVQTLKAQVNTLASASNVALPGAVQALNQLSNGLNQVQGAVNQSLPGVIQLNQGASQLYESSPTLTKGIDKVNAGLSTGSTYLKALGNSSAADEFYIPKEALQNHEFQESINNYLSADKKSAQLIVVFKSSPSGDLATSQAHQVSQMAKQTLKGTSLKNAQVAVGGESSKIYDTKKTASSDFVRTAAIMLIGIGIALIFVTRSVLQPLFILGTLLIAYVGSLSINQGLVKMLMHKDMLTWNTPFFSFIMLIALGVDYSIFLMMRYRELDGRPSDKILKACGVIGTVVISAAIILGGTFAALIPSGVPTLIEVALTVIVGLLILVFLMPVNLSAAIKIAYEGLSKPKTQKEK